MSKEQPGVQLIPCERKILPHLLLKAHFCLLPVQSLHRKDEHIPCVIKKLVDQISRTLQTATLLAWQSTISFVQSVGSQWALWLQ